MTKYTIQWFGLEPEDDYYAVIKGNFPEEKEVVFDGKYDACKIFTEIASG